MGLGIERPAGVAHPPFVWSYTIGQAQALVDGAMQSPAWEKTPRLLRIKDKFEVT